ncbi:hypothetical protein J3R82DRAFT_8109 [Butyriboletus roseoflavus]|nr:hypothetical protein J3R82DRAFT_8109 [Butyriboletus roseoflavus]
MVERRNYDFQELSGRLTFSSNGLNGSYPPTAFVGDTYNIYQSDVLFWMGGEVFHHRQRIGLDMLVSDLNYRLDLPDGDIRDLLLSHVSGIDSIQTLLLFHGTSHYPYPVRDLFSIRAAMATINFVSYSTYRLAPAVSRDQLGYDIKRKPAWTDRILYMAPLDVEVTQLAYRSHPEIAMSDHQPVSADFDISLALVDRSQCDNAVSVLHRELAGFENSERKSNIRIQPVSIEFGNVKYKQAVYREVVIRNEGDIPCVFRFVGTAANSESICEYLTTSWSACLGIECVNYVVIAPSWLRIERMVGLLRPHETTTILLSVYIDNDWAATLNLGSPTLQYTLILHTALGRDDFLTVSGYYQRLTRLDGPIRKLKSPEDVTPAGQAINAPREFMRLINWLMTHVSATSALLFEYPAQERLCHVIRECLDTGDEFPSEGPDRDRCALVAAFSSTLVSFLNSLIEPVVPARFHAECLQVRDKDEAFEVLNAFPHENINVWISLTAFLHYVAQQDGSMDDSDQTGPGRAHRLGPAGIFAPVLLRDDPTGVYPRASPVGKRDFLLCFID